MYITDTRIIKRENNLLRNHTVFKNHRKSRIQHCELRSYVYILSGQKFIKNAKNSQFLVSLHCIWKSQKKSHSILRAKRATFTFWVGKSWLKMPKNSPIWRVFEKLSLRSNSVTRQVTFNKTKSGGKCQNWKIRMRHFLLFFKHCAGLLFRETNLFGHYSICCAARISTMEFNFFFFHHGLWPFSVLCSVVKTSH